MTKQIFESPELSPLKAISPKILFFIILQPFMANE